MPVFTLNRERVSLAFQAGHAGSIPVTRSTEKPLHSKDFHAPKAVCCCENVGRGAVAGPYVPRGYPAATPGITPASWRWRFNPEPPTPPKPLHSKGFSGARGLRQTLP